MKVFFFIICQYLIPQHLLSRIVGCLAEAEQPWFKNRLIPWFIKRYQVDMQLAAEPNPQAYKHFNDFFTRAIAEGKRPIDAEPGSIISPADGCISQIGPIQQGRIFQAKGQEFSLLELIGGNAAQANIFHQGQFATIYLSPKDYHRVHMPYGGTLESMTHVPGDLFSVNTTTAQHVPRLFARNERVVCLFSTDIGPMAVILVGAMIVASIETVWAGLITPQKGQIKTWDYNPQREPITLNKGEELGRFKLGSTAIVLFGEQAVSWESQLGSQSPVQMGKNIGCKLS